MSAPAGIDRQEEDHFEIVQQRPYRFDGRAALKLFEQQLAGEPDAEWTHHGLAQVEDDTAMDQSAIATRVLAPEESARLAYNAQGFLLFLEQSGVLTPRLREMVINRVMALESDSEVDIEELKWVVMMVLFNSSEEQDENALMHYEDIVFSDQPAVFH